MREREDFHLVGTLPLSSSDPYPCTSRLGDKGLWTALSTVVSSGPEPGGVDIVGGRWCFLQLNITGTAGADTSCTQFTSLIHSPGNLHSIHFRSSCSPAPAQRESGAEFINTQVPTERLAGRHHCWACLQSRILARNILVPDLITTLRRSLQGLSLLNIF